MSIQVLLSTMHQTDHNVIKRIGLECDAVVVNQCETDSVELFEYNGHCIHWINSTTRGLSKSRNIALDNATADICLLVDDDEELSPGYSSTIENAFHRHPNAGIISFQAEGVESTFKVYSRKECRIGYLRSMRLASVEITLNSNLIKHHGICFNERIGAGTKYLMGEENALLFDIISKRIPVYYVPELICRIHIGNSSWFSGYNEEYFHARGAAFTAMSRRYSKILILQFALRKYSLYKSSISIMKALRLMLEGHNEYLQTNK